MTAREALIFTISYSFGAGLALLLTLVLDTG